MKIRLILALSLSLIAFSMSSAVAGSKGDSLPPDVVHALQGRGLIGGKLTENLASDGIPAPPPGTEVDVTRAGRINADPDVTMDEWKEPLGKDSLDVRISKREDGGSDVCYWVIPSDSLGCLVYVYKIYDKSGHVLRSQYWTHTDQLKTAAGKNFPATLYPYGPDGGMPASEVFRSLNTPSKGGSGQLFTQYTPEGYVILDIWADGVEDITVPAGTFSALHIKMRPNLESFLPDWPKFALRMFEPFLPQESFYFQANPPYRFLKFEGIPGATGPRVQDELVRYYAAGKSEAVATSAR